MDAKEAVALLRQSRLVRDKEEIESFERALETLSGVADEGVVREIHHAFDDSCQHQEVVFGLVQLLESLEMRTQLRLFVQMVPEMVKHASEWTRILLYRVLNEPAAKSCLIETLRRAEPEGRDAVQRILGDIATQEKPPLSTCAKSVLDSLPRPIHG